MALDFSNWDARDWSMVIVGLLALVHAGIDCWGWWRNKRPPRFRCELKIENRPPDGYGPGISTFWLTIHHIAGRSVRIQRAVLVQRLKLPPDADPEDWATVDYLDIESGTISRELEHDGDARVASERLSPEDSVRFVTSFTDDGFMFLRGKRGAIYFDLYSQGKRLRRVRANAEDLREFALARKHLAEAMERIMEAHPPTSSSSSFAARDA